MLWIIPLMWRRDQWRTWAVLMAASAATYALDSDPWENLVIDLVAGFLVVPRPSSEAQKAIGFFFWWMAAFDLGYGLSTQTNPDAYNMWQTNLGWVQFIILAVWGAHGLGQIARDRFRAWWPVSAFPAHLR